MSTFNTENESNIRNSRLKKNAKLQPLKEIIVYNENESRVSTKHKHLRPNETHSNKVSKPVVTFAISDDEIKCFESQAKKAVKISKAAKPLEKPFKLTHAEHPWLTTTRNNDLPKPSPKSSTLEISSKKFFSGNKYPFPGKMSLKLPEINGTGSVVKFTIVPFAKPRKSPNCQNLSLECNKPYVTKKMDQLEIESMMNELTSFVVNTQKQKDSLKNEEIHGKSFNKVLLKRHDHRNDTKFNVPGDKELQELFKRRSTRESQFEQQDSEFQKRHVKGILVKRRRRRKSSVSGDENNIKTSRPTVVTYEGKCTEPTLSERQLLDNITDSRENRIINQNVKMRFSKSNFSNLSTVRSQTSMIQKHTSVEYRNTVNEAISLRPKHEQLEEARKKREQPEEAPVIFQELTSKVKSTTSLQIEVDRSVDKEDLRLFLVGFYKGCNQGCYELSELPDNGDFYLETLDEVNNGTETNLSNDVPTNEFATANQYECTTYNVPYDFGSETVSKDKSTQCTSNETYIAPSNTHISGPLMKETLTKRSNLDSAAPNESISKTIMNETFGNIYQFLNVTNFPNETEVKENMSMSNIVFTPPREYDYETDHNENVTRSIDITSFANVAEKCMIENKVTQSNSINYNTGISADENVDILQNTLQVAYDTEAVIKQKKEALKQVHFSMPKEDVSEFFSNANQSDCISFSEANQTIRLTDFDHCSTGDRKTPHKEKDLNQYNDVLYKVPDEFSSNILMNDEIENSCLLAGNNDCLRKPILQKSVINEFKKEAQNCVNPTQMIDVLTGVTSTVTDISDSTKMQKEHVYKFDEVPFKMPPEFSKTAMKEKVDQFNNDIMNVPGDYVSKAQVKENVAQLINDVLSSLPADYGSTLVLNDNAAEEGRTLITDSNENEKINRAGRDSTDLGDILPTEIINDVTHTPSNEVCEQLNNEMIIDTNNSESTKLYEEHIPPSSEIPNSNPINVPSNIARDDNTSKLNSILIKVMDKEGKTLVKQTCLSNAADTLRELMLNIEKCNSVGVNTEHSGITHAEANQFEGNTVKTTNRFIEVYRMAPVLYRCIHVEKEDKEVLDQEVNKSKEVAVENQEKCEEILDIDYEDEEEQESLSYQSSDINLLEENYNTDKRINTEKTVNGKEVEVVVNNKEECDEILDIDYEDEEEQEPLSNESSEVNLQAENNHTDTSMITEKNGRVDVKHSNSETNLSLKSVASDNNSSICSDQMDGNPSNESVQSDKTYSLTTEESCEHLSVGRSISEHSLCEVKTPSDNNLSMSSKKSDNDLSDGSIVSGNDIRMETNHIGNNLSISTIHSSEDSVSIFSQESEKHLSLIAEESNEYLSERSRRSEVGDSMSSNKNKCLVSNESTEHVSVSAVNVSIGTKKTLSVNAEESCENVSVNGNYEFVSQHSTGNRNNLLVANENIEHKDININPSEGTIISIKRKNSIEAVAESYCGNLESNSEQFKENNKEIKFQNSHTNIDTRSNHLNSRDSSVNANQDERNISKNDGLNKIQDSYDSGNADTDKERKKVYVDQSTDPDVIIGRLSNTGLKLLTSSTKEEFDIKTLEKDLGIDTRKKAKLLTMILKHGLDSLNIGDNYDCLRLDVEQLNRAPGKGTKPTYQDTNSEKRKTQFRGENKIVNENVQQYLRQHFADSDTDSGRAEVEYDLKAHDYISVNSSKFLHEPQVDVKTSAGNVRKLDKYRSEGNVSVDSDKTDETLIMSPKQDSGIVHKRGIHDLNLAINNDLDKSLKCGTDKTFNYGITSRCTVNVDDENKSTVTNSSVGDVSLIAEYRGGSSRMSCTDESDGNLSDNTLRNQSIYSSSPYGADDGSLKPRQKVSINTFKSGSNYSVSTLHSDGNISIDSQYLNDNVVTTDNDGMGNFYFVGKRILCKRLSFSNSTGSTKSQSSALSVGSANSGNRLRREEEQIAENIVAESYEHRESFNLTTSPSKKKAEKSKSRFSLGNYYPELFKLRSSAKFYLKKNTDADILKKKHRYSVDVNDSLPYTGSDGKSVALSSSSASPEINSENSNADMAQPTKTAKKKKKRWMLFSCLGFAQSADGSNAITKSKNKGESRSKLAKNSSISLNNQTNQQFYSGPLLEEKEQKRLLKSFGIQQIIQSVVSDEISSELNQSETEEIEIASQSYGNLLKPQEKQFASQSNRVFVKPEPQDEETTLKNNSVFVKDEETNSQSNRVFVTPKDEETTLQSYGVFVKPQEKETSQRYGVYINPQEKKIVSHSYEGRTKAQEKEISLQSHGVFMNSPKKNVFLHNYQECTKRQTIGRHSQSYEALINSIEKKIVTQNHGGYMKPQEKENFSQTSCWVRFKPPNEEINVNQQVEDKETKSVVSGDISSQLNLSEPENKEIASQSFANLLKTQKKEAALQTNRVSMKPQDETTLQSYGVFVKPQEKETLPCYKVFINPQEKKNVSHGYGGCTKPQEKEMSSQCQRVLINLPQKKLVSRNYGECTQRQEIEIPSQGYPVLVNPLEKTIVAQSYGGCTKTTTEKETPSLGYRVFINPQEKIIVSQNQEKEISSQSGCWEFVKPQENDFAVQRNVGSTNSPNEETNRRERLDDKEIEVHNERPTIEVHLTGGNVRDKHNITAVNYVRVRNQSTSRSLTPNKKTSSELKSEMKLMERQQKIRRKLSQKDSASRSNGSPHNLSQRSVLCRNSGDRSAERLGLTSRERTKTSMEKHVGRMSRSALKNTSLNEGTNSEVDTGKKGTFEKQRISRLRSLSNASSQRSISGNSDVRRGTVSRDRSGSSFERHVMRMSRSSMKKDPSWSDVDCERRGRKTSVNSRQSRMSSTKTPSSSKLHFVQRERRGARDSKKTTISGDTDISRINTSSSKNLSEIGGESELTEKNGPRDT